jgi:hypothetical protein
MTQHIDELADLYALGMLDERGRAQVDAHAMECEACASRLGEAESTVALLEQHASPARTRTLSVPRVSGWSALAAAAFVIGLLPALWFWNSGQRRDAFDANRAQAVQAMVSSHFAHAQFVALTPDAPKAKLIYSRTGSWVYAVAQSSRALSLRAGTGSSAVTLGTLRVSRNAGELFVPNPPRTGAYALFDGEREVERVTLPRR